jgi:hypothetical protein
MNELRRVEEQVLAAKLRINCAFPRSNDGGEGAEDFRRAVRELVAAQERFWEVESHQARPAPARLGRLRALGANRRVAVKDLTARLLPAENAASSVSTNASSTDGKRIESRNLADLEASDGR